MADRMKDQENKDAESGKPVELPEEQGGKHGEHHEEKPKDQPGMDRPDHRPAQGQPQEKR